MFADLEQLDLRVRSLELAAVRWRRTAMILGVAIAALGVTAFKSQQSTAIVDAQRILLRSGETTVGGQRLQSSRVEMSLDAQGGLRMQYFADSGSRSLVPLRPELRLLDSSGQEIARLGGAAFRPLVK
jgi:hypothetical protein